MPHTSNTDIRIHYQRKGTGCAVLFLGGVGGDLRCKPNVFDSPLADNFDIISFDQRGTGLSDKPDVTYTMAQYAQDAAAVMDAVDWDSAHVVGVSFGGMVAQELALQSPQRVRSLANVVLLYTGDDAEAWRAEVQPLLSWSEGYQAKLTAGMTHLKFIEAIEERNDDRLQEA